MLIFYGTKTYNKVLGQTEAQQCRVCDRDVPFAIVRKRTWFDLFWIPLIPFSTKYHKVCTNCNNEIPINKQEATAALPQK